MGDVAARAHQSMVDRDWPALLPLLHPYLHWTGPDDITVRGRTRVLGMLTARPSPPKPPASVGLRDNQIYRWRESGRLPPWTGWPTRSCWTSTPEPTTRWPSCTPCAIPASTS